MFLTKLQNFSYICYQHRIMFLARIIHRLMRIIYSCDISYSAKIDKTVYFAHKGLGVVVGHSAIIGKNCKILNNVTIGGRSNRTDEKGRTNPLIGEGVLIGAGACLLGPITIANNVSVGANAVVLDDVLEPYSVVVGIPAKVVKIHVEDKMDESKNLSN